MEAFFGLPRTALERWSLAGEHHFLLQGLRMLPMAGFGALAGMRDFGVWGGNEALELLGAVVLMVLIQLAYMNTSAYGTFVSAGATRQRSRPSAMMADVWMFALMGLVVGILAVCCAIDLLISLPVSLSGICLSLGVFAWWWIGGRFRVHYFVLALATLLTSIILPLLGVVPAEYLFADAGVVSVYLAVVTSVGGVADHVLLVLYTRPLKADEWHRSLA